MKQFAVKFIIVIIALVAADQLMGGWLESLFYKQMGEDYFYATQAIDKQEAELVILGSSRARNHYNATLIGDSLGMSGYNCGRSGHFMVYQAAQLDMMLDRYTPKIVVLDVTPYDLDGPESDGEYDIFSALLPYSNHASYGALLRKRSWYEPIKALSKTYRYNSMLLKMVNNTGVADNGGFYKDGFQPLKGELKGELTTVEYRLDNDINSHLSKNKMADMLHIIDACRKKHIKLVMATSPFYAQYAPAPTIQATDSICKANGVAYRSWLNALDFNRAELYHTQDHLNGRGAEMYSKQVASWLKSLAINIYD